MRGLVTIFGFGPTGEATAERLLARGQQVRVVQRRRPRRLPPGADFQTCDVLRAEDVHRALAGAEQAVVTIGFAYSGTVWRTSWPLAMSNLIAAGEAAGVRIVHVDNLYMYGPQNEALHEEMPLTDFDRKPAARAQATRMWMNACAAGRVLWAALRAPDFYGPGVERSHIGDVGFGMLAKGQPATLVMPPDVPHAFAYVPDIARAVLSLLDASDDAFGQAWHVPCAPTLTPREILQLGANAIDEKLKIIAMPPALLSVIGLVSPYMRELSEMQFTWDRPYHVDATKFANRFWSDATPFETGAPQTAQAFAQKTRQDSELRQLA